MASALLWLPEETQQAASVQQHVAQIDARLKAAEDQKAKWTKRLGPFAPIALFLIKFKSLLFLVFKLKFLLGFLAFFGCTGRCLDGSLRLGLWRACSCMRWGTTSR